MRWINKGIAQATSFLPRYVDRMYVYDADTCNGTNSLFLLYSLHIRDQNTWPRIWMKYECWDIHAISPTPCTDLLVHCKSCIKETNCHHTNYVTSVEYSRALKKFIFKNTHAQRDLMWQHLLPKPTTHFGKQRGQHKPRLTTRHPTQSS